MDKPDTLEEKLALLVARFASQTNNGYTLTRHSGPENRILINITIGKWDNPKDWEIKYKFIHEVGLLKGILDETYTKTSHVSDSSIIRKLYMDFVEYMNSQGIHLVNDFENVWKSDPKRYRL